MVSSTGDSALLGTAGAARCLGLSEKVVRREVDRGALAVVKVGGRLLFRPEDLDAYVAAHRVPATTLTVAASSDVASADVPGGGPR